MLDDAKNNQQHCIGWGRAAQAYLIRFTSCHLAKTKHLFCANDVNFEFEIDSRFLCQEGFEKFYLLHFAANKYTWSPSKLYLWEMGVT